MQCFTMFNRSPFLDNSSILHLLKASLNQEAIKQYRYCRNLTDDAFASVNILLKNYASSLFYRMHQKQWTI